MNKKAFLLAISTLSMLLSLTTSCSPKLAPLKQSNFAVTPNPLETVGMEIPFTIDGTFPEKWFDKNAVVTVIPVLKYGGNKQIMGLANNYQGENVQGNALAISNKNGGGFKIVMKFPYNDKMFNSRLWLKFEAKIKNQSIELPEVKVADGVIATSTLASALTTEPSLAEDGFQRIIKDAQDANILFVIQQADLRSSELNKSDISAWKKRVEEAFIDPKQNVNVEVSAYASPDGGASLNEKLSEQREKNTSEYLEKELKNKKISTEINANYTAQDWEGFRKLVEASDLQDKELVLRVLSMYPDAETREHEIKNISYVFEDIAKTILPQLRRARITANIEIIGKSDQEIRDAWKSNPEELKIEELLYASTLTSNSKEKQDIYQYATINFPEDYRAWNNIGVEYYKQGDLNKAKQAFERAEQVSPNAAEINANKALLEMIDGNIDTAKELLGNAAGANNLGAIMGLLYTMEGNYNQAVDAFGDIKSNNAAVAQILSKDYNKALTTLKGITIPDATNFYLRAIIASRTNNFTDVVKNLRSSLDLERSVASKAKDDLEFSKYLTNEQFTSLFR